MICCLCPGFHAAHDTLSFLQALGWSTHSPEFGQVSRVPQVFVYPAPEQWPVFPRQVLKFLQQSLSGSPAGVEVVFIGFSAGVVGALGAAHLWQQQGGRVQCMIALDGWGVPLWGDFPIHRLSHDHWTHVTTGGGQGATADFYADPVVAHLELWRSPQRTWGWRVQAGHKQRCTATEFMETILGFRLENLDGSGPGSGSQE